MSHRYILANDWKDIWDAISDMVSAGASGKDGISSILLAAPKFDKDCSELVIS